MAEISAAAPAQVMNTKPLFKLMVERKASDLFFTCNAPVKIKIEGKIFPVNKQVLSPETVRQAALGLMTLAVLWLGWRVGSTMRQPA